MFEFLGLAIGLYLLAKILSGVVRGTRLRTMLKACDFAEERGVPSVFCGEAIAQQNYETLRSARALIAQNEPEVRMLDVYEQFGLAIIAMHKAQEN